MHDHPSGSDRFLTERYRQLIDYLLDADVRVQLGEVVVKVDYQGRHAAHQRAMHEDVELWHAASDGARNEARKRAMERRAHAQQNGLNLGQYAGATLHDARAHLTEEMSTEDDFLRHQLREVLDAFRNDNGQQSRPSAGAQPTSTPFGPVHHHVNHDIVPRPRIQLLTAKGNTYEADYVIITAPLGVLKDHDSATGAPKAEQSRLQFVPPLPKKQRHAIESMKFGSQNKVYLQVFVHRELIYNNSMCNSFKYVLDLL